MTRYETNNSRFEIGDSVKLAHDHLWPRSEANPTDVIGKVVDIDKSWVYVEWGNGEWNGYKLIDADLVGVSP